MKYTIPRSRFFSSDPDRDLSNELVKTGIVATGLGAGIGAGIGKWGKKSRDIKNTSLKEISPIEETISDLTKKADEKISEIKNSPKIRRAKIEDEIGDILRKSKGYDNLKKDQKERVDSLRKKLKSGKIGTLSEEAITKKVREVEENLLDQLKPHKGKISEISKKASKSIRKNVLKGAGKGALYTGLGAAALGLATKKLTDK